MTSEDFALEFPGKVALTKYLPVAKPMADSTWRVQNSDLSPITPGRRPSRVSLNRLTALQASVVVPKLEAYFKAALMTRYASITSGCVRFSISDKELGYGLYVTITRLGKKRGVNVAK